MSSVFFHNSGSLTYFFPSPSAACVLKAHLILGEAEDFEILQIHVVHRTELFGELLLGAIDVGVVHVERTHAHEAEQLAALLVAIASAVFREAQRQVAVTVRFSREDAVMMRTVHGFEVIMFVLRQFSKFPKRSCIIGIRVRNIFGNFSSQLGSQ